MAGTVEASQRLAARIAGFTLLLLMISGLTGCLFLAVTWLWLEMPRRPHEHFG